MNRLIITPPLIERISRLEPETRNLVLGHIFDLRINELCPDVSYEPEAIRLIWPDILREYARLDNLRQRVSSSRQRYSNNAVTQEVPLSPQRERFPQTPSKEKDTSHPQEHFAQTLFERFWSAYPRKVSKKAARRVFLRLIAAEKDPEAFLSRILTAIAEQTIALDWCRERKEFIPHPTTWLNGERWNDDLSVARSNPHVRLAPTHHACNWRGTRKEDIENVF